ncbi:uncharacterized protein LOC111985074 [Quercus suber]|uniref:uncharacterized protein LOC111985074 n=1 Tax=Quercus suber TaxID=58331 RepID=UPI000CE23363|nr:uncharacterized protein LOC111985074 [Quercus suber]
MVDLVGEDLEVEEQERTDKEGEQEGTNEDVDASRKRKNALDSKSYRALMVSNSNSIAKANVGSSHRVLTLMKDPSNPFFLHHGETHRAILVSQPLTEARAMKMALDAKSKLGFIDGSITASMATTPIQKQAWSRNNNMISSWILNSISPHITTSVIYRDTTFEVRRTLKNSFS